MVKFSTRKVERIKLHPQEIKDIFQNLAKEYVIKEGKILPKKNKPILQ